MAKLARLALENYRNIKSIEIVFGGKDGKIIGLNRIGKTNVLEAICYLLTDKLLGGSADIPSIKPHGDTRQKVVVEGNFLTDEGEVILRKEFYEKWVRPRGSAEEELTGHATDYYINGAKQARAKDFFEALETKFGIPTDFCGMDAIQLIIDPFYLGKVICGSKDWKFARKAVIGIVGDVTPEEIFSSNPQTEIAKADLEAHQFDDGEAKKAIRGEIEALKKQITANEGLINEYNRAEDIPEEEVKKAEEREGELTLQLEKLKTGDKNPYAEEVTTLQGELYSLQREYSEISYAPADHSKSEAVRKKVNAKRDEIAEAERIARSVEADIKRYQEDLDIKRATQQQFKKTLKDLQEESLSIMVSDTCPTCGQKLPEDKVEEAVNTKKAELTERATHIREQAVANKKAITDIEKVLADLMGSELKDIGVLKNELADLEAEYHKAYSDEANAIRKPDPKLQERIGEINKRLAEIREIRTSGSANIQQQENAIKAERDEVRAVLSKKMAYNNAQKRLAEIRRENVAIGKKQADAEQRMWAVGEFVKTKLSLLDEHMASKLGEVRFQLIKENIKAGSYDEVCVPYIIDPVSAKHKATLYPDGSMSEQIYTGIQIIKAIRDAKGWNPLPILFDQGGELDARSASKVAYDAEAQIIAVKVEGGATTPTFVPFDN